MGGICWIPLFICPTVCDRMNNRTFARDIFTRATVCERVRLPESPTLYQLVGLFVCTVVQAPLTSFKNSLAKEANSSLNSHPTTLPSSGSASAELNRLAPV